MLLWLGIKSSFELKLGRESFFAIALAFNFELSSLPALNQALAKNLGSCA
jgi:hypothetical protein